MLVWQAGGTGSLASATVNGRRPPPQMLRRPGMANEANVSLIGFVATQPKKIHSKTGTPTVSMRVGWAPRILNKSTGEWSDLPSSFATVWCYRKVAEHASLCLRRGEPIVLRGTLRVREYTDQNGQRRSTVEITADSIGHDISRGLSTYSKLPARTELTADEYEQAVAAGERNPLPGDIGRAADDALGPGRDSGEESLDADMGEVDSDDAERAVDEDYDRPSAGDMPVDADDPLEPVGASD
jgi:single-strand DNA-binding protein